MKLSKNNLAACAVTFDRPDAIRATVESFVRSLPKGIAPYIPISVISNHSNCPDFSDMVSICQPYGVDIADISVVHNAVSPDCSWGHLSRSWNQCLYTGLLGRENVIFFQDDVEFREGWFELVNGSAHEYYCAPLDGQIQLMSRRAFLRVGWYDERILGIDFEGYDYLNRVYQNIPDIAMIEDNARDIHLNDIGLSEYWIANCDGKSTRPRGEERMHHRWNRHWLAMKRGLRPGVRCHKDGAWRSPSVPYVEHEIDWYPWATAKIQHLAGEKQSFMQVPFTDHYGHEGYDI